MCGSWGKGGHLGRQGARTTIIGKRRAVGLRPWRRIDIAEWLKTQETSSPHQQETFMHRVSVIVHCVIILHLLYNHNRSRFLLYYLFQENKSFGSKHHLHSSSDVREVVSSTGSLLHIPPGNLHTFVLTVLYLTSLHFFFSNFVPFFALQLTVHNEQRKVLSYSFV
jgi:hypothetical protein